MNVGLSVQLGIQGSVRPLVPIWLDVGSVGATSTWAGSYHVLAMGRHYDDYMVTPRIPNLPSIPGFPAAHPYERLAGKIRAPGITGNIGEAIAALFARRYLNAGTGDVAHIKPRRPFRRRRSPDYMMRLGGLLPGVFSAILPNLATFTWPTWMPVESKARSTDAGAAGARRDALRQLTAYWTMLAGSQPGAAGYGIVVTFNYQLPREVRASLFIPSNQTRLISELLKTGDDTPESVVRECVYGG